MPEFPPALGFLSMLEPIFTKPAFILCIRLMTGWILYPGKHTIIGIYPFADPKCEYSVQLYHYFFRTAIWPQGELFVYCARFLVGRFAAGQQTLLLVIDDITHKKTGRKVDGARVYRDAVRSATSETVFCWAPQYIPLCLLLHPPWEGEPLAIPLTIRLNRKNQGFTLLGYAADTLRELGQWLLDHDFRLVADGASASLAGKLPPRVTHIFRFRVDTALFELPPPPSGKCGRPRRKGTRLLKAAELAKIAPERAGAFAYLIYGTVWLARIEREGKKNTSIQRKWSGKKNCVSFLDVLADVRQQLWNERIIAMSSSYSGITKIQELLVHAIVWAA
ncbi:MAG: transposase [Planctomycetota bacterium]|jgi:hypothetical protein|nr:transposase [Planctomycetota bacterium]